MLNFEGTAAMSRYAHRQVKTLLLSPIKYMEQITVIIPLCNIGDSTYKYRVDALNYCLEHFYSKQLGVDLKVIIAEQIIDHAYTSFIPKYSLNEFMNNNFTYNNICNPNFNKAWMYNCAVNKCDTDHIVFTESEMFSTDKYYFKKLIDKIIENEFVWAIGWNKLNFLTEESSYRMIENSGHIFESKQIEFKDGDNEGGFVYFNKSFYKKIGMANELMNGLGRIDNELACRATWASGEKYIHDAEVFHLYHPKSKINNDKLRDINIKKYEIVKERPLIVNKYLASQEQGNIFYPLCDRIKYSPELFYKDEDKKLILIKKQEKQKEMIKRVREKRKKK
jgi:hypothetical protein